MNCGCSGSPRSRLLHRYSLFIAQILSCVTVFVGKCLQANWKKKMANYFIVRNGTEMSRIVDEHTVLGFFRAKILESKALAASPMDCVPECPQVWCPEVGTGEPMSYSWPLPQAHQPLGVSSSSWAGGPGSQFIVLLSYRLPRLKRRDVCC